MAAVANSAHPRDPAQAVHHLPKDRIDSVSKGARSSRIALQSTAATTPSTSMPRNPGSTESSADEETSIVQNASGQDVDYQSTQRKEPRAARPNTASVRTLAHVPQPGGTGLDEDAHQSWQAKLLSKYGSIELENKGSVARDHLALERTFLAWLRTSLAFASIGIAITQLFRLNTTSTSTGGSDPYKHLRQMGKPLGATFLGISIAILFVGFHRYFESQHWIIRGKFPASRGSIALVAAITLALMVTSLVIVVVVEPGQHEKR